MRRLHDLDARETLPGRGRLLAAAGIPPDREPSAKVGALLDEAVSVFLSESRPRAVEEEIGTGEFLALLADGGREGEETVLDRVVPRADHLSLFAATVGGEVSTRVAALFAGGDSPQAFLLDAVAAESAARLGERLGAIFLARLRAEGNAGGETRVLPYSPGYCGWRVEGQRALFARLWPEEIGIRLNEGGLMDPAKSVSGVLVAGTAAAHRFRPDFEFCDGCEERRCLPRMASLRGPGAQDGEGTGAWTS